MGVKYVVIRNDLGRSALNGAWPARIHQALGGSPGLTRVAQFGTIRGSNSPTLAATQPAATFEAADDFTEPGWSRYQSVARYVGIADVTAPPQRAADCSGVPG